MNSIFRHNIFNKHLKKFDNIFMNLVFKYSKSNIYIINI